MKYLIVLSLFFSSFAFANEGNQIRVSDVLEAYRSGQISEEANLGGSAPTPAGFCSSENRNQKILCKIQKDEQSCNMNRACFWANFPCTSKLNHMKAICNLQKSQQNCELNQACLWAD